MGETPQLVTDTNVLLNLATPVVDSRADAPEGERNPLQTFLQSYDVHAPESVLAEVGAVATTDDLLGAAATHVLQAQHAITTHAVTEEIEAELEYGLDTGESHAIWLANQTSAEMLVTDEFSSTNYLLISVAIDDRSSLYATPEILCLFGREGVLHRKYVSHLLSYLTRRKDWDTQYISLLRKKYLGE